MGCDIHAYVEYSTFQNAAGEDYWDCFISNAGGRDYDMFGILAGVRAPREPVVPLRGLPEFDSLSWRAQQAAFLRISDDERHADIEGFCTTEQAKGWRNPIFEARNFEWTFHPDWHSPGWLTADEFALCLGTYMTDVRECYSIEWDAILASMRAFEERGAKTRLTFWFDN